MKYIVTKQEDGGLEEIFTFPDHIHHDAFAEALEFFRSQTYGNWERVHRVPVAAGFVVGGRCSGRSESLGLDSRPNLDTAMLLTQ